MAGAALFPAETKSVRVDPHAMQYGRELAGDGHPGFCHAAAVGDFHPPCPQRRPLLAARQKRMRRFIERHFMRARCALARRRIG